MSGAITNKTMVPLFTVLGLLPILVGGILWLSSIDAKASSAQVEAGTSKILLLELRDRTIRIEEQLRWLKEQTLHPRPKPTDN